MITNELLRLKVIKYKGLTGNRIETEILLSIEGISCLEKQSQGYTIHLIGDGTLYLVTDKESIEKLDNFIHGRVM